MQLQLTVTTTERNELEEEGRALQTLLIEKEVDNITPEDEEFFSVSLNSSDPAVNLRPRMITITVLDDDGNICS